MRPSPPQIENALNEFGQLDGLILDVRLNGGGSSSVVDPIFEHFVTGRLGQFVNRATRVHWRWMQSDPKLADCSDRGGGQ